MTNTKSINKGETARQTAKLFLDIAAVHFNTDRPFIFTLGWASPVYIDCRRLISFPDERNRIIDFAVSYIRNLIGVDSFDVIAGFETASITYAAWISDNLDKPMVYVRKEPKGFARNALIEGHLHQQQRVLMIDDLATDGRSKIRSCRLLREAGAQVEHAFVFFYYDIFIEGPKSLKDEGIELHALTTLEDVLHAAKAESSIDKSVLTEVESFLANPVLWSKNYGA